MTMVANRGRRLARSCQRVLNSSDRFFLIMIARKNGAIISTVNTNISQLAHGAGIHCLQSGIRKRRLIITMAIQMME